VYIIIVHTLLLLLFNLKIYFLHHACINFDKTLEFNLKAHLYYCTTVV